MRWLVAAGLLALLDVSAQAAPREVLAAAAFQERDRDAAIAKVASAEREAVRMLAARPNDRQAAFDRAMAVGYRAKLEKSRSAALTSRRLFEALAARNPNDPEARAAIGAWHLDAIDQLGGMLARTALGARRETGVQGVTQAASLGRDRAMFPALAALMLIRLDVDDVARARGYAEAALEAPVPTAVDRIMQRNAAAVLAPLKAGDGKTARKLARTLLPFGRLAD
jgi:hypothetical protein